MSDLILDVAGLSDLLAQYFKDDNRAYPNFHPSKFLDRSIIQKLNPIVREDGARHLVIASAMAFAELVRKWDEIVDNRFQPYQLAAFLESHPAWFSIQPVDEDLVPFFGQVPTTVELPQGRKPIEWIDAIHVATALSRTESILVTPDVRLIQAMHDLSN